VADAKKPNEKPAGDRADLMATVRRAEGGDETALPALRQCMDTVPALVEALGDLAGQVETSLIRTAAGNNLAFKEGLSRKMNQLRRDVAGPNPSPLERLLADRIALCWLSLHDAEVRFAQFKDSTIKQADHWQRRIDSAHRRYLTAIKALATVRKLAVPAVQVNIARKQVNVLNTVPEGTGVATKSST
jgi:hypothetical protein